MRDGRSTVGVPCCATEISEESGFCKQCEELFMENNFDDDGFVELEEESLPEFFERYEPGKSGVFWHAPPVVHAEDLFSGQIHQVKDQFAGTSRELDRDWPNASFKEVASSLCFGAGILFDDADRDQNPYKRTLQEQVDIGKYLSKLIGQ